MSRKLLLSSLASMFLFGASQIAVADEEIFKQIDADQSGTISAEEATVVEGLQESMAEFDANGDGQLDSAEFSAALEAMDAAKAAS